MDGRNCTGRKISLLNESSDVPAAVPPTKFSVPSLTAHSRASSSCSSTPSLSPQTPHLVRSSSSDSRAFQTPSPLTPSFAPFPSTQLPGVISDDDDNHHHHHNNNNNNNNNSALQYSLQNLPPPSHHHHHHHHHHAQHYYFHPHASAKMDDPDASLYPPIPDATALTPSVYSMTLPMQSSLPPLAMQQQHPHMQQAPGQPSHRVSNSPSSEPSRVSTVSAASNTKPPPKKNQYPCPLAKQVGCNDYFTTSGHAARHAKKHTGKKDAFCPECNKAFTRKDNMEQHRRTHQNGRGANRAVIGDDSKVKKNTKSAARKVATKVEPQQLEAAVQHELAEQQAAMLSQTTQGQPIMPQQIPQAPGMEAALMIPPSALGGPYYLGPSIDSGPIPALPMAIQDHSRPMLQRNSYANNLEYLPPPAPMLPEDAMHYSYPSPGLSNGLNSLALAASEHRRLSEEKTQSSRSPSQETLIHETP